jgi:hypothetical protein
MCGGMCVIHINTHWCKTWVVEAQVDTNLWREKGERRGNGGVK